MEVLFVLVILLEWIGAAGALFERYVPTVSGALGLFLLDFWQFTISLVMLPTSGALFVTALLLRETPATELKHRLREPGRTDHHP